MSNHWTKEQEEALSVHGKNLLLSAAAGSGKTAVLTERIARLVKDPAHPVSINELLVLTFTKAAASEMKTRISAALSKALEEADERGDGEAIRHLEKQISLLGTAQISTLDSFFQSLIRQYFYLLDLDPKMRILSDANEEFLLEEEVLSEVLETWYEKGDPDFLDTVDLFASRYQDRELKKMVLSIFKYSRSMPFPDDWLSRLPENYRIPEDKKMDELLWSFPLLYQLKAVAEKVTDSYRQMFQLMDRNPAAQAVYTDVLSNEYAYFSEITRIKSWDDWFRLPSFDFARLPTISKAQMEEYHIKKKGDFTNLPDVSTIKKLRTDVKDKSWKSQILPFMKISENQWIMETRAMEPVVAVLSKIALDFSSALAERKKQEGLMDFNDMEHYALQILLDMDDPDFDPLHAEDFPSEAALSIRDKYKEVMVDEYQDTNGVQELIISLVSSGNNRFMVGDIKQSIYRFRQADPTIFLAKYRDYEGGKDPSSLRIDLNKNFRSDATLLSSINFLFRQIMTKEQLELDYGDAEALYPGRHEETRPDTYVGGSVTIDLIDKGEVNESDLPDETKDMENITIEGRLIAQRIQDMMESGRQVMNKDGTFRPIRYSDIVILLRSIARTGPALVKVLEENHIPAISDKDEDFMNHGEVEILWALLKILDNPLQDLPLAAVLRSYFVDLDEKDLSLIYLAKKERGNKHLWSVLSEKGILSPEKEERISHFLTLFEKWREEDSRDGTAPLLRKILEDSDYLTYVSGLPSGPWRRDHVISFYQLALARDSAPQSGLYSFLRYLGKLTKEEQEFKTISTASSSDAVRIMTIHKSKGLEFPVVFLADAQKGFNLQDSLQTAICHKDLGLGIQYYDKKHKVRWPSLYWYALREKIREESVSEEARLLYVAMTRARDKLFITAISQNGKAALARWATSLSSASSEKKSFPLPSHIIYNGKSFLEWIMPAALRHRSMKDAWGKVDQIPSYLDDAPSDSSSFTFHLINQLDLLNEEEKRTLEEKGEEELSAQMEDQKEEELSISHFLERKTEVPEWLSRQLAWKYDYPGAAMTPAKLTATAAVHLRELAEYRASDEEPLPSVILADDEEALSPDYAQPPLFLAGEETKMEGTSFGTLMHKAMEMIDFNELPADREKIREKILELGNQKVFTDEEIRILLSRRRKIPPIDALLQFKKGILARAMEEALEIRKEMPFSILLPASSFYPNCEEGEKIFLQGVMDCLIENEKDIIIIDYKTDRTLSEEDLKDHYKVQLQVYGEAAEKLLGKPVTHLYLWSFTYGKALKIEKKSY